MLLLWVGGGRRSGLLCGGSSRGRGSGRVGGILLEGVGVQEGYFELEGQFCFKKVRNEIF
jgi:hypothetical protein